MRTHVIAFLTASALLSTRAVAEEFGNFCAWPVCAS